MHPMPAPARLLTAALLGLVTVAAILAAGLLLSRPAQAQDLGLAITKTLRGNELVQVGQILEFSIRITNTGTLPVVELELVDQFVSAIVAPVGTGPFAKPGDPPLSDTPGYVYDGNETITWQLLGGGQTLDPGESLEVIVRLRAIRPSEDLQTVNRARIERAIRSDGQNSGGGAAEAPARPSGARLPMTKSLGVPAPVAAGLPITFTITITNEGAVDVLSLPLRDIYNPAALRFESADPPPLSVDEARGILVWDDLLVITGRGVLRPGESITVLTYYTALRDINEAVNVAEVSGARDEYGNQLDAARAEAPIRVVNPGETATADPGEPAPTERPEPTATIRPFPTAGDRLTPSPATATPEPTPSATIPIVAEVPAVVPTAEATPVIPATLPNTGASGEPPAPWLTLGFLILLIGWLLAARFATPRR